LLDALLADFELRGIASGQNRSNLALGTYRAVELTPEHVDKYIQGRLAQGHKPASINRPLQLVGQAFTLAVRRGSLNRKPYIRHLREGNARTGFFSEQELNAVVDNYATRYFIVSGRGLMRVKPLDEPQDFYRQDYSGTQSDLRWMH
jgi:hypothetical protein